MSGEADRTAIEKMIGDWLKATNKPGEPGADGYAAYCTKDAVMLPPNAARVDGRASIRDMALGFTSADSFKISWKANRIDVFPDGRAHAIGEYRYSLKDGEGKPVSDTGKFFDALRKQPDGSWQCAVGCWNSDLPAE